jgi:hypothetical protein
VQRQIPGLLFYEDNDEAARTPYMHTANDTRGLSLNDDELYLANARTAAATIFTLARPIHPPKILLRAWREPGDPETTVRLQWEGGFPAFDVHRREFPQDLSDDAFREAGPLGSPDYVDSSAAEPFLFYSIEENP